MQKEIVVSLLMPIYNVESYLREALDSAVGQNLRDIEIICIDDGSTDHSATILDEYAANDSRVHVIHQVNGGYGKAMNTGLTMARGKYVAILEPDDFLDCHMLSDLYLIAEQYQLDFVKSDFSFVEGEAGDYQVTPTRVYWQDSMYDKVLSRPEQLELFKGYLAFWACLYRRSFLEKYKIRFNETPGASYQDTGFWFQTMVLARRVYLHEHAYYHYRQDNLGASMLSKKKVYCITEEYDFIYKKLQEHGLIAAYWPQYIALRFIGHRDALLRIADRYKREFTVHIARDFGRLQADGRLDMSFMDGTDQEMLERILEDPVRFYQEMADVPRYIHEKVQPYKDFYIYGAGSRGKKIFDYLDERDEANCRGFLVSENNGVHCLKGKPVQTLKDAGLSTDTGIIVGVTARYHQEIIDILRQRGIDTAVILAEDKVP